MDLREIGWEGVEWMQLAQDRDQWQPLVKTGSVKGREFIVTLSFSRAILLRGAS